ncbi:MAG TPA: class I SAM-dependent methyltransferase [Candidatus Cybelea sp.]|jgi:SAM-dependent methyltransferase|nr:class I SAM-dependent methyltransferase [Candidatus Cybelea sp.]
MNDSHNSTSRFGARARSYAAFRPGYPAEAIDALLAGLGDPASLTIADVGAGTGISSRLFAERGAAVLAIEPNASMRSQAQPHPNVRWLEGTAGQTGLADASVDLVVAAQAFHWFATPQTCAEFARVTRRRAALLQYERDESHAFTHAYGDVVRAYATDDTEALRARGLEVFASFPGARVARTAVPGAQPLDYEGLLGRAASSSYLPSSGPAADSLRRDLAALFERYERDGIVELRTLTHALTADFER